MLSAMGTRPAGLRFVGIEASSLPAPGATGIDHRLHIALALLSWQLLEVRVSDVHTNETRKHFRLRPSEVAIADRGYAQCHGMSAVVRIGNSNAILPQYR